MSRVAILQSNYIPWRGYFDIIRQVDHFVFYDEVQYTKNDWRNRNVIVPQTGRKWLTLGIATSGKFGQTIAQAQIKDPDWAGKHADTIAQVYRTAPEARTWLPRIRELYARQAGRQSLSTINQDMVAGISTWLGLPTRFHDSQTIDGPPGKTERLIGIVKALGGQTYLSGAAAKDYLDVDRFRTEGIGVEWMDYGAYPQYRQLDGGYHPGVSILDTLLNAGLDGVF